MKNGFAAIVAGLAAAIVAGGAAAPARAADPVPVRMILNWKFEGPNAPFFLAEDRGYFAANGVKIQLDAGEGSSAPPSRIASGAYDAGFGDITSMIEFSAKNPQVPLRTVFMLYNRPPLVVVSLKKKAIKKPADLVGKTLGAPVFDAGYRMWPTFAKAAGIDAGAVKWINMQPNLRESLLIKGEVDAVTGYDLTVGFSLKAIGVSMDDTDMMYYADYGIDVYSNAIMVSKAFADKQPAALKGLLAAINRGWRESLLDPDAAITALLKRDGLLKRDVERERLEWAAKRLIVTPEALEIGLGAVKPERLERTIDIVTAAFALPARPSAVDVFDAGFLPPAAERAVGK
ncbi:MAG: ABC transporter substrate-binding protein [Proteobacteria bacterium]|nr:ABC transporter substrate-binding protein [Pseudomonadota bacterium]